MAQALKNGFKSQTRGPKSASKKLLSPKQEKTIPKLILDKDPEQLKLSFAWWSREVVRRLMKQQPGLEVVVRTMGTYLKKWGFTPQKPVKRAYQRNDPQVLE